MLYDTEKIFGVIVSKFYPCSFAPLLKINFSIVGSLSKFLIYFVRWIHLYILYWLWKVILHFMVHIVESLVNWSYCGFTLYQIGVLLMDMRVIKRKSCSSLLPVSKFSSLLPCNFKAQEVLASISLPSKRFHLCFNDATVFLGGFN